MLSMNLFHDRKGLNSSQHIAIDHFSLFNVQDDSDEEPVIFHLWSAHLEPDMF